MAYTPAPMRQGPPTRPPSMELPAPVAEPAQVQLSPQNTWPCGCPYPGAHQSDCMWNLWEQMRSNYLQTKTLMSQFMTQVDSLQTGSKAQVECECPSSCHGRDLGQAMGLQQMQGVTVPWLQPPTNVRAATTTDVPRQVADAGNYTSETRKLIEEQRRIQKTWLQFHNIFDIALDLADDVSKDRREAARRRKELERLERQERREEERRESQKRRESCAEEKRKSKDEEEAEPEQGSKKKSVEKEQKRDEKRESDGKPSQRRSTKQSVEKEEETGTQQRQSMRQSEEVAVAKEEPEESPQPEATEGAEGAEEKTEE